MTRRRRNLKDLLTPDPTPDRQLTHPSGWCMTNSHEGCPRQFRHGLCGCSCHSAPKFARKSTKVVADDSQTQKTQEVGPVVSIINTPKKRGRPKKVQDVAPNTDSDYIDPRPWMRKDK